MTSIQETSADAVPQWQTELDQLGFWRRLILSRRWYGADWWFVAISGALLLFIFSMAIFPGFYAPYDPRMEVGPSFIRPGERPPSFVLVGKSGQVEVLDDLIGTDVNVGIVKGSPSSQVLREVTRARQAELLEEGSDLALRPRNVLYDTIEEALAGLANGEVIAIVGLSSEIEPLLENLTKFGRWYCENGENVTVSCARDHAVARNHINRR